MSIAAQILANESAGMLEKNEQLVRIKLKELVYDYTEEVVTVLRKTGIATSAVLPDEVILTIVIKHLHKNKELREVIAQMLLALDGHYGADGEQDGKNLTLVGGALSAIGSVLAGIGRGQFQTSQPQDPTSSAVYLDEQALKAEEQARKRRTTVLIIGVSLVLLVGAILTFRMLKAGKPVVQINRV